MSKPDGINRPEVVDGDIATQGWTAAVGTYIKVTWPSALSVTRVRAFFANTNSKTFTVDYWNGTSWVPFATYNNDVQASIDLVVPSTSTTGVRLYFSGGSSIFVNELEAYADKDVSCAGAGTNIALPANGGAALSKPDAVNRPLLVDGDVVSNGWLATAGTYVKVYWTSAQNVTNVTAYFNNANTKSFTIDYWNGTAWAPFSGGTFDLYAQSYVCFSVPSTPTTGVRLNFTSVPSGVYVNEFQAWSGASPNSCLTPQQICANANANCGTLTGQSDGCGNNNVSVADCSFGAGCAAPNSCNAVLPNQCGCAPLSDATICSRDGKTCGSYTTPDNGCGGSKTVTCPGTCTSPQSCSGGTQPNVCGCTVLSDPAICSRDGKTCGSYNTTNDGCGGSKTVTCTGTCTAPQSCSGGTQSNVCGCTALTDAALCSRDGKTCGSYSTTNDGCGGSKTVTCSGTCSSPQTCSGGSQPNVCGCTPLTGQALCNYLGKCGSLTNVTNNCGGTVASLSCSTTCPSGQSCGGGGTANVCGSASVGRITIAAVGDIVDIGTATGESQPIGYYSHLVSNLIQARRTQSNVELRPSYLLAPGDLVRYSHETTGLQAFYNTWWAGTGTNYANMAIHNDILLPVPGNHEYQHDASIADATLQDNAVGYFNYFSSRLNTIQGMSNAGSAANVVNKGWYSINANGWHIVAINTNGTKTNQDNPCGVVSCAATSAQLNWLRDDLDRYSKCGGADTYGNTRQCMPTIVFFHHNYIKATTAALERNTGGPSYIWKILYDYNVDIAITSHQHFYQRFVPMNNGTATAPMPTPETGGVTELIVGSGGVPPDAAYASTCSPLTTSCSNPSVVAQSEGTNSRGALFLTLGSNGTYSGEYRLASDQSVFDSFSGTSIK